MNFINKRTVTDFISQNQLKYSATQRNISIPIVNRIYKKMMGGIRFSDIYIKDGVICDGHHRYLASLLANYSIGKADGELSHGVEVVPWELVFFMKLILIQLRK